jgi:hypothetical protein
VAAAMEQSNQLCLIFWHEIHDSPPQSCQKFFSL